MKGDSLYSINWRREKYNPKIIVNIKLLNLSLKFLFKIEWCVQVIVIPDEIKIFNRRISKGLNGLIPIRGHSWPISIKGASDEWK